MLNPLARRNAVITILAAGAVTLLLAPSAGAQDSNGSASYLTRLVDTAAATRLNAGTSALRFEAAAGLFPRHELRISSSDVDLGARWPRQAQALAGIGFAGMSLAPSLGLDPYRATYRYTVFEQRQSAFKVGLTTNLRDTNGGARPNGRHDYGVSALPLLHLAGEGKFAQNWLWSVDADGMVGRARALDLGLRVDYLLSRDFSLFGGYRLADSIRADEPNGNGVSNAANVGLRLRF
jgi:hypothetical protein